MATSTAIVREVLNGDNYSEWSVTMKSYLQSLGLWDSLTEDMENYSVDVWDNLVVDMKKNSVNFAETTKLHWKRKDASALHAIHVSCNSETFSRIKEAKSANEAWNTLEMLYSGQLQANLDDIEQGIIENHGLMHLRKHIYNTSDWSEILKFMESNREAVLSKTSSNRTVVHMAVIAGRVDIIDKLVNKVAPKLLLAQDINGLTALGLAACLTDNEKMVKPMVKKDLRLLTIRDNNGLIPVVLASEKGHKEMTRYLYNATFKDQESLRNLEDNSEHRALLFARCIREEIFDIALDLLQYYDNSFLSVIFDDYTPLSALAQKATVFPSGSPEIPLYRWQIWKYKSKKRLLDDQKLMHDQVDQILKFLCEKVTLLNDKELQEYSIYNAMLEASKHGIVEFIECMTSALPHLFSVIDEHRRGIFSYAILNRHTDVFSLIHNLKERKDVITSRVDVFGNTLLHLAAMKGPTSEQARECGPAMQMQTEFQWFQAVKQIVHPKYMDFRNNNEEKPRELFIRSHEQLVKDGESWAKGTAKSYTIVAALITTIMFAAAFTVPGGYDQTTGIPLLLYQKTFTLFIVADLVSLFSSAISVLVFIGIMTSRFTEIDFLKSLPTMLLVGISSILIAVLTMMVAFMAALRAVLRGYLETFVIVFFPLVSLPILFHVKEQFFPIIADIYTHTYKSKLDILKNGKSHKNADTRKGWCPWFW